MTQEWKHALRGHCPEVQNVSILVPAIIGVGQLQCISLGDLPG